MAEQEVSLSVLEHLTSEISRISQQQTDAMLMAAFLGMREEEAREYRQRQKRLAELVIKLAGLTTQKI